MFGWFWFLPVFLGLVSFFVFCLEVFGGFFVFFVFSVCLRKDLSSHEACLDEWILWISIQSGTNCGDTTISRTSKENLATKPSQSITGCFMN